MSDTFEDQSYPMTLAKVRSIDSDGNRVYLEFRNGTTGWVGGADLSLYSAGAVVLVHAERNYIELAPDELWPEETWVGIVRLKTKEATVLTDSNGRLRKLQTRDDVSYREGNTVEATDSKILSVLSEDPIKYLELAAVDDSTIAKFKTDSNSGLTFEDFGGFQDVVQRARELIEVPLLHKNELSKIGARSIKGVLFTGPPGTGKTMLARIIANSTDAQFYEISGPQIFSKWYGQSEEILRKLFEVASNQEKAIIFFDEIDSVAGQRGDESHEASKRVVAQLLTLMDGFTPNDNVIVIATTNRPQDIDIALRRPGRFDWEVHFSLPNIQDRADILQKTGRNKAIAEVLPYKFVAHNTEGWSAADLAAIWTEAALLAVKDNKRSAIIAEDFVGGFERVSIQRHRTGLVLVGGTRN
jgi:transitional endoplasmic reticulum ATPase